MDTYLEDGKHIYEKYCSTDDNEPTMLPRAPEQTYIDVYPDEDQPGPSFADDKRHQIDYETEVKVYRALEKVDGNFIVLHSFKYSHHQYRLCAGKSHIRKGCLKCKGKNSGNLHGECDFLIICADKFIVIEVKNMDNIDGDQIVECEPDFHLCSIGEDWQPECTTIKLQALIGTYRKSAEQRSRVVELIRFIDQDATILQFTAYPNFSIRFKDQFQFSENTELRLTDNELSTIIFEEDICRNELEEKSSNHSVTIESTSLTEQSYLQENWFSRLICCFSRCCKKDAVRVDTTSDLTLPNSDTDSNRKFFKSDKNLSNFVAWWAANVTQANSPSSDSHETVRNILLAMWATESKTCDESKCSLGRCIMDVNKELKQGRITFEPRKGKNRNQNPGVVKAPDVIRNNVKVENLTVEQDNAFKSKENFLWINGPAGAGKTVILCGKILQLINSDSDNKVVVLKFAGNGNNSQHYQNALDNASIKYELISTSDSKHTPAQLANLITKSLCNVVIVEITGFPNTTYLTDILSLLSGYNLFVDDIQTVISHTTAEMWSVLINKLLELSANNTVWIACDLVQIWYISNTRIIVKLANSIIDLLTPNQRATLTMNLRNTFDLSNILSEIRDQFVKICSLNSDILDLVLPAQSPGHFIHGPLPVIHVFNDSNDNSIGSVFNTELDRLCATLNYSDIGIVYTDYSSYDVVSLVMNSVDMRCVNTDSKIAVCHSWDCASSEWPAVIVVHSVLGYREEENLTNLYLALSRARVYCSVVMYPERGTTLDSYPHMLPLLDKLSNYARIIRH